jgi:hypothetical protein
MQCDDVKLLLADYSAENLREGLAREVEGHLRGCVECRGLLAELVTAGEMVGRLEALEAPAEVWRKIQERGKEFFPAPNVGSRWSLRWSFSSAVGGIIILLLSAILSLHFLRPRPPEIQPSIPTQITYQVEPASASNSGSAAQFYHQHAATASRDSLEDPVGMGLMMFVDDQQTQRQGK